MKRKQPPVIIIIFIALGVVAFIFINGRMFDLPKGETTLLSPQNEEEVSETESSLPTPPPKQTKASVRKVFETDGVNHSIPVEEIRQGCFGRDCIPSVDEPKFISKSEADKILPEDTVGIGLTFNGETRFYPFNMLVTREIVNDTVGGHPLAVTYCPLCGTGIVFDREVGGRTLEFGVSGMLWQSNLLMYNRESEEENISLWSQVLGEAVLGPDTGTKLSIVPSDIVRYVEWAENNPDTQVLNTGRIGDPYNGDYYGVAKHFNPSFDEASSEISPTEYVFGINMDGKFKAYVASALKVGTTKDEFVGREIEIVKNEDGTVRIYEGDSLLEVVSGFWFSWAAAHEDTEIYK